MIRPNWDEYFIKIAFLVAERSTCKRHHVSSIIVKDKRILSTGYNGAASGIKDCLELGCLRDQNNIKSGEKHEICRAIHAEQNTIIQAGLHGVNISGGTLFCTHDTCILCAKMIVNAKIKRVVCSGNYPSKDSQELFKEAGVVFEKISEPNLNIFKLD
ncbi:MAG: cytidine/deoxycytidylate deaminase family protein [Nanoarchaeota archaeon]|nr:cytidine/deoxycytidylate deaminase family protein [Nanoarchaeota archaeon]